MSPSAAPFPQLCATSCDPAALTQTSREAKRSPTGFRQPLQGLRLGSFDCLADVWAAATDTCSGGLAAFQDSPNNMTGAQAKPKCECNFKFRTSYMLRDH